MIQSELTSSLRSSAARVEVGSAPGTFFDNPAANPTTAHAIGYGPDGIESLESVGAAEIRALHGRCGVVWVHVEGLADTETVRVLAAEFGSHELAIADIVNTHQRPKVEEYDDQLFVVLRAPCSDVDRSTQQLSMLVGDGYLLTFAERHSPLLAPVRRRLENPKSRLRAKGSDFLAYAVLDTVVDSYFPLLEVFGELVESVENRTIEQPDRTTSRAIHALRADLLMLRRCVWPLREIINEITRGTSDVIGAETRVYLRDCYDHAVHVLESVETYRELAFGLVDLYMASLSSRMNEIMKVLTLIATVFMPLSFIASVYGMNFDRRFPWNMPELGWTLGYPFALGLMAMTAGSMFWFFRRKGWIGSARP